MGTQTTRLNKIAWVRHVISMAEEKGRIVDESKLIKEFCIKFGSTERTAKEIINILK